MYSIDRTELVSGQISVTVSARGIEHIKTEKRCDRQSEETNKVRRILGKTG
jgi:hypothetical protein